MSAQPAACATAPHHATCFHSSTAWRMLMGRVLLWPAISQSGDTDRRKSLGDTGVADIDVVFEFRDSEVDIIQVTVGELTDR